MARVRVLLTAEQQALAASMAHLPPARADVLSRRFGVRYLRDDMEGEGSEGLSRGAQKFSPVEGTSFPPYAAVCVDNAIVRFVKKEARARNLGAYGRVVAAWGSSLVVPKSGDEMDPGGDDERSAVHKLAAYVDAKALSAALALSIEREEQAEKSLERSVLMTNLAEALRAELLEHSERDRRLFVAIYGHGRTVEEAAAEVGIAYPTAKARHRKLLSRLREALEKRGFGWVDEPG